jgi:hypothetical protein
VRKLDAGARLSSEAKTSSVSDLLEFDKPEDIPNYAAVDD